MIEHITTYLKPLPNLDKWRYLSVVLGIVIASFLLGIFFTNPFVFLVAIFIFLVFVFLESTYVFASTLLALMWALLIPIVLSFFSKLSFFEALSLVLSFGVFKILTVSLFLIAYYFHISAYDLIKEFLHPFAKRIRYYFPLKNKHFQINIEGKNLNTKQIRRYVDDVLYSLMPNYNKEAKITIKEVEQILESDYKNASSLNIVGLHTYKPEKISEIQIANQDQFGIKRNLAQKMDTLAHELVHTRQCLTEELDGLDWHGVSYKGCDYWDQPWEVEAREMSPKLYKEFWFDQAWARV